MSKFVQICPNLNAGFGCFSVYLEYMKKYVNIWNKTAFDFYPREVVEKYLKEKNLSEWYLTNANLPDGLDNMEEIARYLNDEKMLEIVKENKENFKILCKRLDANPIID